MQFCYHLQFFSSIFADRKIIANQSLGASDYLRIYQYS